MSILQSLLPNVIVHIVKMAFGFGVGDCVMLAKFIFDTIQNCKEAPKAWENVANTILGIEVTLEIMDEYLDKCHDQIRYMIFGMVIK